MEFEICRLAKTINKLTQGAFKGLGKKTAVEDAVNVQFCKRWRLLHYSWTAFSKYTSSVRTTMHCSSNLISLLQCMTMARHRCNGTLARYVELRVAHAPGMPGTFSPSPRVTDPDMHHGTCVTHVPWCMLGSLTGGFLWIWWLGKRSRHSRRMRNPQFYVSGKRPMVIWCVCFTKLKVYHKGITGTHQWWMWFRTRLSSQQNRFFTGSSSNDCSDWQCRVWLHWCRPGLA